MNKYIIPLVILILAVFGWKYSEPDKKQGAQSPTINPQTQNNTPQKSSTEFSSGTFYTGGPQSWSGNVTSSGSFQTAQHFTPPNTNWPTRTLSGITYVFGEGNPKEVALTAEQLKEEYKKCGTSADPENTSFFCREESGYVSPEVENYLLMALTDPSWESLFNQCQEALVYQEKQGSSQENLGQLTFGQISSSGYLQINNFVFIDPESGRKILNVGSLIALHDWLRSATNSAWESTNGEPAPYGNCTDKYGIGIIQNIEIALQWYRRPPEVFGPVRSDLLDPKQFKLFN